MIHRIGAALAVGSLLALTACGSRTALRYPLDSPGPARPRGAPTPPTPQELLKPETQARPERDDEVLRRSEERESDPFELPPEA